MAAQPFFLNSRDAYLYGGSYTWIVNEPYLNSFNSYGVSIDSMVVPNVVYPFNIYNQQVYFKENGGATLNATLSINNYTGAQFATELQTQLNASAGVLVYTVTYDSQAKLLQISVPGPDTIQFVDGDNNANDEMGLAIPTSNTSTITSDYPVNLSGTNFLSVRTSFASRVFDSSTITGTTLRLPVDVGFGNIIFYEASFDDMIETLDGSLAQIVVSFADEKDNPWILPANAGFSMTLRIQPNLNQ